MKRLIGAGLALAIVVIAGTAGGATVAAKTGGGGCHDPKTEGAGVTVDLKNNCFLPTVLHIERGAEVRFESFDKQVHTVTGVGRGLGLLR
jgi:plastocyanin